MGILRGIGSRWRPGTLRIPRNAWVAGCLVVAVAGTATLCGLALDRTAPHPLAVQAPLGVASAQSAVPAAGDPGLSAASPGAASGTASGLGDGSGAAGAAGAVDPGASASAAGAAEDAPPTG
ncbi:MAG: hypothetical protein JWR01_2663, partial [Subtercola sp.]|nr:hypothetical protein [Subtercola sp.]